MLTRLKQTFTNFKNTHPKLTIVIATLSFVLLVALIFVLLSTSPPVSLPIGSPSPSSVPSGPTSPLSQAPTEPIDLPNLSTGNPSQTLTIAWPETIPNFPQRLPYAVITIPLITNTSIISFAKALNFTDNHKIPTQLPTEFFWLDGNRSLSAATTRQQLRFTDTTPPPTSVFPSENSLEITAIKSLKTFFPDPQIIFTRFSSINYFSNIDTFSKVTTASSAQIAQIPFTQTLEGLPLITTTISGGTVTVALNPQQNLQGVTLLGGFSSIKMSAPLPVISAATLQTNAATLAQRLPQENISTEAALNQAPNLTLTVNQMYPAYLTEPGQSIIQPVIVLTGSVSGPGISSQEATYVVPALTADNYKQP